VIRHRRFSAGFSAEASKGVQTLIGKLTAEERDALVTAIWFGRGRWRIAEDGATVATEMELRRKCLLRHSTDYLTSLGAQVRYVMLMQELG